VIHIIGADHGACQFLGQVIFFIGNLGRHQDPAARTAI
jgi:hypothetical protein